MSGYVLSATALRDLKSIWQYTARDSLRYADLVEEAVIETCRSAARLPHSGINARMFAAVMSGFFP